MNVRKAARRCYTLLLFLLPVCLIIGYSAAYDFTFKPCTAPPQKNKTRGHFTPFVPGRREPYSSATGSKRCTGTERIIQVQNDLSSRHKPITYLPAAVETLNTWSLGGRRLHISKILENKLYSIEKATVLPRKRRKVETARELRYDIMIRDAILTCVRQPTRVSLIYRTETTTEK